LPHFIYLNNLKPALETSLSQQTGINIKINGNINFSLIGPTILAHDVSSQIGTIKSVQFKIPVSQIFNTNNIKTPTKLSVYGADIKIEKLIPPKFAHAIQINDSVIHFMNKDYKISNAMLENGLLNGTVRTNQHKYDFKSDGDIFSIINKNENLEISGHLYSDGTAHGQFQINTKDINQFFEFNKPKINTPVKFTMNFDWDGKYEFKFNDIKGDNFNGDIQLFNNNHKVINLTVNDLDLDISFLLSDTKIFYDTDTDLNLNGDLKLGNKIFHNIKIKTIGDTQEIKIINLNTDNINISGGKITSGGAEKLPINFISDNKDIECLFSGTPQSWNCEPFKYQNMNGKLNVDNNQFTIFLKSENMLPDDFENQYIKLKDLAQNCVIDFIFSNATGSIKIQDNKTTIYFDKLTNKTLTDIFPDLSFLPKSIMMQPGTISGDITGNEFSFIPNSNEWNLRINKNEFIFSGNDIKDIIKNFASGQILFIKDNIGYIISGNFNKNLISNLTITIADQTFTGSVSENNITLKTPLFNLDSFTNQNFIDTYEEQQFLSSAPLTMPFNINKNVSLSADYVIYNGNEFSNFVYSLRNSKTQTFSITDAMHGNLLGTVSKDSNNYDITLQLNKFDVPTNLLSNNAPINIINTTLTAQIDLKTNGKIAYDVFNNMSGYIDMDFNGGTLIGLGTDNFYANKKNITLLNAENFLSNALNSGQSKIKNLRIIGKYENGSFTTTRPFVLQLQHTDITGNIKTESGNLAAQIILLMRGTSPNPTPIYLNILPDGSRQYSLSEIMKNFDPDFLRNFTNTHNKF